MHKLTTENMAKAIERAKAVHPTVKAIDAANRIYAVSGSTGATYTVKLGFANGHRLGQCNCKARTICFHIAAASALNAGIRAGYSREANPADKLSTGQLILETAKYYPYGHGYLI